MCRSERLPDTREDRHSRGIASRNFAAPSARHSIRGMSSTVSRAPSREARVSSASAPTQGRVRIRCESRSVLGPGGDDMFELLYASVPPSPRVRCLLARSTYVLLETFTSSHCCERHVIVSFRFVSSFALFVDCTDWLPCRPGWPRPSRQSIPRF